MVGKNGMQTGLLLLYELGQKNTGKRERCLRIIKSCLKEEFENQLGLKKLETIFLAFWGCANST